MLLISLIVLAALLVAAGCRLRRPTRLAGARARVTTAAWVLAQALLAAAAISCLDHAFDHALAPWLPGLDASWSAGAPQQVVTLIAVALLVWFAESETPRVLLLAGAGVAAISSAAAGPFLQLLGLELADGSQFVALSGVAAAAALAPLMISTAGRAHLITRTRQAAMVAAGDQILVLDPNGGLLHATEQARRTLNLGVAGQPDLPDALASLVRDHQARRARLRTRTGRILEAWSTRIQPRGSLSRARGILVRDATGRYKDQRRLMRLAHYDSLTGLPNRRLFLETLTKVVEEAEQASTRVGLLYIDLDDFKAINDSLGHGAGDKLLEVLAERFRTGLVPEQVERFGLGEAPLQTARLSGDEFAVVIPRLRDTQSAYSLAEWILELVGQPVELGGRDHSASASIGVAISPEDGRDLDELIRHADIALYSAKTKGRRRFARYDSSFDERAERTRSLENGLQQAIERNELRLCYQPKVDVRTGTVTGLEALMRWTNADLGDVGPAEFIPVAEERGLICELGTWAIQRACRQMKEWRESGFRVVPVAVNVSSHQFREVDLQSVVTEALQEYDVDPQLLELELTESLLLEEGDQVEVVLRDLRSIGVRIALDDFGTGYSALTYLNRFTLDVLKMDRELLRDIDSNPSVAGIVTAVVSMAHSLGLSVVAEGVDCPEQVPILRDMRCDQIQGFLYAPGLPPDEVVRYLANKAEAAPVCHPQTASPASLPKPALEGELDDAPVLRDSPSETFDDPLQEMESGDRGRVLMVDDDEILGLAALRLGRLGVDVHYAAEIDEARLLATQEGDRIRVVAVPPSVDLDGLRLLMDHLVELCGERRRVIVMGERPEEARRTALREAGVDWVLWSPFNDVELRCLMKSAMALPAELADRREPRVPVDLVANISSGGHREVAVVSSLSPHGAFIETSDPLPMGSSIRIEIEMPRDRFRGFARVVHVQREDPSSPYEPSGMGVTFFGSDRHTERILRKAVKELEARYLP